MDQSMVTDYRVRPGDPLYLIERRCQARLLEIREMTHQQTIECLHQCEILELKVANERLRWELREAQRSRR